MIKIATWNLCLGLFNKKEYVYQTLNYENIDLCLFQEAEIEKDLDVNLLSSKNYCLEVECVSNKARCAVAIKNNLTYTRRTDLEDSDLGIMVIDINNTTNYRIVNLYRQFNPPNNLTQIEHFSLQINKIKNAVTTLNGRKIIIAGDFNLDDSKRNAIEYRYKNLFEIQNASFDELNLIQIIEFPTWQRIINNVLKESVLDHVYVQDPTIITKISSTKPLIGDHKLITFDVAAEKQQIKPLLKRNWHSYTKPKLLQALATVNFNFETDQVQNYWDKFEASLLPIIDDLIPMAPFINNCTSNSIKPSRAIKRKLNLRKRLLRSIKTNPTNELRTRINNLNLEIKNHFHCKKSNSVRRNIIPGNSKSLWDAVKISKDINAPKLPETMYLNNLPISNKDLPDSFAESFISKVNSIVDQQTISDNVYNGVRKIESTPTNFMTEFEILKAIKSMKPKNCEGHDRIPLRILIDGIQILIAPLSTLFNKIYNQKKIPEQWLISKVIPIHKKGPSTEIQNYRPISNLCSCSKIYEKLILARINSLEKSNNIDLTGKSQHGFKPNHSTLTAGLQIQSLIARAVDGDMSVLMASLDLSSAFDVVNVGLLLKRIEIIGLPPDVIELISIWLTERFFYVSVGGINSYVHRSGVGTVQGSVLGPILYSLFVSPLLDLEKNYPFCR